MVDDGKHHRVAIAAVGHLLVISQYTILLGTQARDGITRRLVMPVGSKLHSNGVQLLKGMGQQQQLALGIHHGSLAAPGIPGITNFQPPPARFGITETRGTNNFTGGILDYHKCAGATQFLLGKGKVNIGGDSFGSGDGGIPEIPQFAVTGRGHQRRSVLFLQGPQRDRLAGQGDGVEPG